MRKLVGEHLREISPLTRDQIVAALRNQMILKDAGDHKRIGELLLEAGQITREQLDEALRQQGSAQSPEAMPSVFGLYHPFTATDRPEASL